MAGRGIKERSPLDERSCDRIFNVYVELLFVFRFMTFLLAGPGSGILGFMARPERNDGGLRV
jgi:hypothetical protein